MPTLDRRTFVEQLLSAAAALPLTRDFGIRAAQSVPDPAPALRLEYTRAAQKWVEALPVGSGRLGAMVFGGIGTERLQLNDDTLWSGGPSDTEQPEGARGAAAGPPGDLRRAVRRGRRAVPKGCGPYTQTYLPMGDLVALVRARRIGADYRRSLDLRRRWPRRGFASATVALHARDLRQHPAQVIVMRLTADRPGQAALRRAPRSQLRYEHDVDGDDAGAARRAPAHVDPSYFAQDDPVRYADDARNAIRDPARAPSPRAAGARRRPRRPRVENADAVTLLARSATSFNGFDRRRSSTAATRRRCAAADLRAARGRLVGRSAATHVADHRALFDRVSFARSTVRRGRPSRRCRRTSGF